MDLGARAAGAGVAHHPEVVLLVAVNDVDGGVEALAAEDVGPDVVGFLVEIGRVVLGLVGRINGGEKALRRHAPDLGEQLPAPGDRLLLEVVAEGPVAEHLEHRVVVGIPADVFEVVVFAAGADALLGVGGAVVACGADAGPRGDVGLFIAEEDGHELVHAGVGEEQSRRVGQQRGARHDGVLLAVEEIEEGLADLGRGHGKIEG